MTSSSSPALRRLYTFGLTLSVLLTVVSWYLLVRVPRQQDHQVRRNYRVLAFVADRLANRISSFKDMLDNTFQALEKQERPREAFVKDYLALMDDLEYVPDSYGRLPQKAPQPAMTITPRRDEWTSRLQLEYRRDNHKLKASASLTELVKRYLPAQIFDDVLLADRAGNVVFQRSSVGPRIYRLRDLLDKPRAEAFDLAELGRAAEVARVAVGGGAYYLFLHPAPPTSPEGAQFTVCGLVESGRFLWESRRISYNVIALLLLFLLAPLLTWRCFEVFFMGPQERFGRRDGVLLALSTWISVCLLTLLVLGLCSHQGLVFQTEAELESLAGTIRKNFLHELDLLSGQLEELQTAAAFLEQERKIAAAPRASRFIFPCETEQPGPGFSEHSILDDPGRFGSPSLYPYFSDVVWVDCYGRQRIKWSVERLVSNRADVRRRDYFQAAGRGWSLSEGQARVWLEPVYSMNTGKNVLVLSRYQAGNALPVLAISSRLSSVTKPVLPPGSGFAIVKRDNGDVLFHSEETRNLNENFFVECDGDEDLESRVTRRDNGAVRGATYQGAPHSMYVSDLGPLPWSLIVFRDQSFARTPNAEVLTVSTVLFLLYGAGLLLLLAGLYFLLRRNRPAYWFWPCPASGGVYARLILFYLALVAWFLLRIRESSLGAVLLAAGLFPLLAVLGTAWLFRPGHAPASSRFFDWRAGYMGAAFLLLMLLGLVPCYSFFRVAYEFEMDLMMRNSRRFFARALPERAKRIRLQLESLPMPATGRGLLLLQRLQDPIDLYYQDSFHLHIGGEILLSEESDERLERPAGLDRMLLFLRPHYNALAKDTGAAAYFAFPPGIHGRRPSFDPFRHGWGYVGLGLAVAMSFGIVLLLAPRVFLLDLAGETSPTPRPPAADAPRCLVLVPPVAALRRPWELDDRAYRIDIVELAATGEWGEAAVSARMASQPVLLLDHFEYRMDDPACNERKLTLLERLAGDGRKSIHILSAFDPIPYLTAAGPAGGPAPLARWLAALSSFRRTAADDRPGPTPAFQQALVDFSSRLSSQLDPQTVHRLQKCFLQECGATASLQALGAEIAATLSPQTALDIQQLVGLIADRAAAYYATLWESSSRAEKAALAQLAQSGMVNPNNRDAIGQLCQRGLVQRNPAFSLMNESFRRFLLSALKQHEVARWEREAANQTWSTVKIIYLTALLAGIVFVALTQRETLQSWLPYLTGLGGTLVPGLTRLMSASLGSRDGPAPGSA